MIAVSQAIKASGIVRFPRFVAIAFHFAFVRRVLGDIRSCDPGEKLGPKKVCARRQRVPSALQFVAHGRIQFPRRRGDGGDRWNGDRC